MVVRRKGLSALEGYPGRCYLEQANEACRR